MGVFRWLFICSGCKASDLAPQAAGRSRGTGMGRGRGRGRGMGSGMGSASASGPAESPLTPKEAIPPEGDFLTFSVLI